MNIRTSAISLAGSEAQIVPTPPPRDDWGSLQEQVTQSGELILPIGDYYVSQPIIIGANCQIRGQNGALTTIHATANNDIFRTRQAQTFLDTGDLTYWDEWVTVRNLCFQLQDTGAAITMCQAGEMNTLEQIKTQGGQFGLLCIGVGQPGVRLNNVTMVDHRSASICIDSRGIDNLRVGGPMSFQNVSSDNRGIQGASFIWLRDVATMVCLDHCKLEGGFDSMVRYDRSVPWKVGVDNMAGVTIKNSTWNCNRRDGGTLINIANGPVWCEAENCSLNDVPTFVRDQWQDMRVATGTGTGGLLQVLRKASYP